eukprot:Sspe_Gene.90725::Locus_62215_Transcript_1_1_Confidence_1.000_Length_2384::g.90725::m.90725
MGQRCCCPTSPGVEECEGEHTELLKGVTRTVPTAVDRRDSVPEGGAAHFSIRVGSPSKAVRLSTMSADSGTTRAGGGDTSARCPSIPRSSLAVPRSELHMAPSVSSLTTTTTNLSSSSQKSPPALRPECLSPSSSIAQTQNRARISVETHRPSVADSEVSCFSSGDETTVRSESSSRRFPPAPSTPGAAEDPDARRYRLHLIKKEIYDTEVTYMAGLNQLCNYYLEPMKQMIDRRPRSSKEDKNKKELEKERRQAAVLDEMFGNLMNICACNMTLLKDMRAAIVEAQATPSDFSKVDYGKIFVNNFKILRLYASYINTYDEMSGYLSEIGDERIHNLITKTQRELESTEGCQDVSLFGRLITPVQRLVRYRLLLQQLVRYSEPDELLDKAYAEIDAVCCYCNQKKKESDGSVRVREIQEEMELRNLVRPGRYWLMDGEMEKVTKNGRSTAPCKTFLFSDLLLCIKARCGLRPRRAFWLLLDDVAEVLTEYPSNGDLPFRRECCFSVRTGSYTLGLILPSATQRAMWYEAVISARRQWTRRSMHRKRSVIGIDLNDRGVLDDPPVPRRFTVASPPRKGSDEVRRISICYPEGKQTREDGLPDDDVSFAATAETAAALVTVTFAVVDVEDEETALLREATQCDDELIEMVLDGPDAPPGAPDTTNTPTIPSLETTESGVAVAVVAGEEAESASGAALTPSINNTTCNSMDHEGVDKAPESEKECQSEAERPQNEGRGEAEREETREKRQEEGGVEGREEVQ